MTCIAFELNVSCRTFIQESPCMNRNTVMRIIAVCTVINTCRSGVNGDLIAWFAASDTSSACQEQIAEVLRVTGAYSISGECVTAGCKVFQLRPHSQPQLRQPICHSAYCQ